MDNYDSIIEKGIVSTIERAEEEKAPKEAAELISSAAKLYDAYNDDLQGRVKAEFDAQQLEVEKSKIESDKELKLAEIDTENRKSRRNVITQVASIGASVGMAALCFKWQEKGELIPDKVVKFAQSFGRTK